MKVESLTGSIGPTSFKANSSRKISCPIEAGLSLDTELSFKGLAGGDRVSFTSTFPGTNLPDIEKIDVKKLNLDETFRNWGVSNDLIPHLKRASTGNINGLMRVAESVEGTPQNRLAIQVALKKSKISNSASFLSQIFSKLKPAAKIAVAVAR